MRQFFEGKESSWAELETRVNGRCVRFRDQEMPVGCSPSRANVGFEVLPHSSEANLLVQYGVQYTGNKQQLREWFLAGEKRFSDFQGLRNWVCECLFSAYLPTKIASDSSRIPKLDTITDITKIRDSTQNFYRPMFIKEGDLYNKMRLRVRGQDSALRTLSAAITRHCARCQSNRPAVLFAIGPSGVGKTRTAESLGVALREISDGEVGYDFLRLDMTEYQEAHRVSQLIGAPQGYIGHGEGSQLIDTLRNNPRTIVLFDEIEKAHPAILRVLMNAMDAGRLSTADRSARGRNVDCKKAVFIFTSNLDAKLIIDDISSRNASGKRVIEDDICRRRLTATGIAPEIVGRIGRFLIFRPLTSKAKAEIITLSIIEIAVEYGIEVAYVKPEIIVALINTDFRETISI